MKNNVFARFSWLLILLAGIFWGAIGIFSDTVKAYGFTELQTALWRVTSAAVMFVIFILIKDKSLLKIKLRDLPLFLALGCGSVLAMTCLYFLAIAGTSYSVAAILLYTAPIFVSVTSVFLFKEKFTVRKGIALILAFAGCVCVSGIFGGSGNVTPIGFLFGILSGVAYALYSILGTFALRKYSPYTVTTYAFLFAALGALIVCDAPGAFRKAAGLITTTPLLLHILLLGLISAFLPFLLYTIGLSHTEAGKASIIASVEPLAATVCGVIRGQKIGTFGVLGILGILAAVIVMSVTGKKTNNNSD